MQTGQVIVIAGPTASGKSALAVDLAQSKGGVVINADSLQLYDALPILTAQPGAEERAAVPHRLYGTISIHDRIDAERWRSLALTEIDAALAAGQTPIVVGGTGFYLKALMEGLSPVPPVPEDLRGAVRARMEAEGPEALHTELAACDPALAARLAPSDRQRIARGLEVFAATGRPLSFWQSVPPTPPPHLSFTVQVVMPERAILRARCDARLDVMVSGGVLEEIAAFEERRTAESLSPDAPILNALGYAPLRAHVVEGTLSLPDALTLAKAQTRQYAKRQTTWIRGQMGGA